MFYIYIKYIYIYIYIYIRTGYGTYLDTVRDETNGKAQKGLVDEEEQENARKHDGC